MDETLFGSRNARGEWTPTRPAGFGPLFDWPTKPLAILRWIVRVPGYLLPWNALYLGVAATLYAVATLVDDDAHLTLAPVPGHCGFEKIELGGPALLDTNGLGHYLHHKYFEVNYSAGAVPFDRWFGSFHEGSPEARARMKQRLAARSVTAD